MKKTTTFWLNSEKTDAEYTEYNLYKSGVRMGGISHRKGDDFWSWWVYGIGKKNKPIIHKVDTEDEAKKALEYEV